MTSAYDTLQMQPAPIPRAELTTAEAVALLVSREPSNDVTSRLAGWMIQTAKSEAEGRFYNHVSEEIALFVRSHRALIESLPAKLN